MKNTGKDLLLIKINKSNKKMSQKGVGLLLSNVFFLVTKSFCLQKKNRFAVLSSFAAIYVSVKASL